MVLKVAKRLERLPANITFKWGFTCMYSHVHREVTLLCEGLATIVNRTLMLGCVAMGLPLVVIQPLLHRVAVINSTVVTLELALSLVNGLMVLEVMLKLERFPTLRR